MEARDVLDTKNVTLANGKVVTHTLYREGSKIMEDREVMKSSAGNPDAIDHMIIEAPSGMLSYN